MDNDDNANLFFVSEKSFLNKLFRTTNVQFIDYICDDGKMLLMDCILDPTDLSYKYEAYSNPEYEHLKYVNAKVADRDFESFTRYLNNIMIKLKLLCGNKAVDEFIREIHMVNEYTLGAIDDYVKACEAYDKRIKKYQ